MTTGNWPSAPPQTGVVTVYLTYHIWYADLTAYQAAIATYGNQYILRSPAYMRDALGISETAVPWDPVEDTWIQFNLAPGPAPVRHNFDGTWAAKMNNQEAQIMVYPSPATETPFYWPSDGQYVLDYDKDWFIWPASPAISGPPAWPVGKPTVFIWEGLIMSKTGSVQSTPTGITPAPGEGEIVRVPIRPRRFSTGFETTTGGAVAPVNSPEGLDGQVPSEGYTRYASRTPDGIGFMSAGGGVVSCRLLLTDNGTPSNTRHSAERIYVKFTKFPTTATRFHRFAANTANGTMNITIDQNGQLNAFTINNFLQNSGPLGAGSILALNTWYRLDPYIFFAPTGTGCDATLVVKVKGVTVLSVVGTVDTGFGPQNLTHASSTVEAAGNGLECCYDDWENIDPGSVIGTNAQEATIDYWTGVHMQLIKNTGFNENTDWTGDYLRSMQRIPAAPLVNITSSTSGARLSLTSDMNGLSINDRLGFVRQQGTICLNALCAVSKGSASTTDEIGIITGLGEDTAVKSMGTALQGYHQLFNVSAGELDPIPVADLEPCYPLLIKSADANATNVVFLALEATFMGQYGAEDTLVPGEFEIGASLIGYHNAPYWATFLGRSTVPPPNGVAIASGTYLGNGTFQNIEVELFGIHWLLIRNTATNQKTWWWSSHLGPHLELADDVIRPALMIDIDITDDGTTIFKLTNANNASNANGVTYQYIAFSDPMSRVLINTPFRQGDGDGVVTTLFDSGFTPEFAMVQGESVKNNSGAIAMYTKGAGFGANEAKNSTGVSPVSSGMTFGTGQVTELGTIDNLAYSRSMALWRQYADNNNTKPLVTLIDDYVGNGAVGDRNIIVALGTRRPLLCMVIPLNSNTPYLRDPSHLTNTSTELGTNTNSTTAITGGGVDEIIVGTSLNQNGVTYSVFILPACTNDAGNGGWGVDGVCALADPGWEDPPDWFLTPPDPPGFNILGSGGIIISGNPAKLLLKNVGGIYKLIKNQRHDQLQDTQTGQPEVEVPIPEPGGKTGFIGG